MYKGLSDWPLAEVAACFGLHRQHQIVAEQQHRMHGLYVSAFDVRWPQAFNHMYMYAIGSLVSVVEVWQAAQQLHWAAADVISVRDDQSCNEQKN